jgi:hypothetical protein
MGRAEKEWARRKRVELMTLLGNVCAHCGTDEKLEFDCIFPRGDRHHRGDASQRMCFYRASFVRATFRCCATSAMRGRAMTNRVLVLTAPLPEGPF